MVAVDVLLLTLFTLLVIPFTTLLAAVTIWVVGKLDLGFEVRTKRAILWIALAMALLSALINGLWRLIGLTSDSRMVEAIIHLATNVLALLFADWIVPGFKAKGLWGVLIAAVATSFVGRLLMLLLKLLGPSISAWAASLGSWQGSPPSEMMDATLGGLQISFDWANGPFVSVLA